MIKNLKVIKEKTCYSISDDKHFIRVLVSGDGTAFTITPNYDDKKGFVFMGSKAKTIISIANLLIEATKLK